jgi:hypothetical protein
MRTGFRFVLATILFLAAQFARADGEQMLLEHQYALKNTKPVLSELMVNGMHTLHETLRNDSGRPWRALRIEIVRQDPEKSKPGKPPVMVPVLKSEGASFMITEPVTAWRPTLEVRIDQVYLGQPGGAWEILRNPDANTIDIRLDQRPVMPGETLQLRLRLNNVGEVTWHLRYTPEPARNLRHMAIWGGSGAMILGAMGLVATRRRKNN